MVMVMFNTVVDSMATALILIDLVAVLNTVTSALIFKNAGE